MKQYLLKILWFHWWVGCIIIAAFDLSCIQRTLAVPSSKSTAAHPTIVGQILPWVISNCCRWNLCSGRVAKPNRCRRQNSFAKKKRFSIRDVCWLRRVCVHNNSPTQLSNFNIEWVAVPIASFLFLRCAQLNIRKSGQSYSITSLANLMLASLVLAMSYTMPVQLLILSICALRTPNKCWNKLIDDIFSICFFLQVFVADAKHLLIIAIGFQQSTMSILFWHAFVQWTKNPGQTQTCTPHTRTLNSRLLLHKGSKTINGSPRPILRLNRVWSMLWCLSKRFCNLLQLNLANCLHVIFKMEIRLQQFGFDLSPIWDNIV